MATKVQTIRVDEDVYRRILKEVKDRNPQRLSVCRMGNVLLQYGLTARAKIQDESTTSTEKGK